MMYICDHRYRHISTLDGPVKLVCKLNHCPDPRCAGHAKTKSPETAHETAQARKDMQCNSLDRTIARWGDAV